MLMGPKGGTPPPPLPDTGLLENLPLPLRLPPPRFHDSLFFCGL